METVDATIALARAGLFAWVARLVLARDLPREARGANALFGAWWGSFALLYAASGVFELLATSGVSRPAVVTYVNLLVVLICVGLWALLGYLVYLYSGSRRWFAPLGAAYAVFGVALLYLVAWMEPVGVREQGLATTIQYARQLDGAPAAALGALLAGPVALGAIAYGSLYLRVKAPEARYRIALVAGSFLAWFGWATASGVLGLSRQYPDSVALYVLNQALATVVPLAVLAAYRPPRWVREWLDRAALRA